MPCYLSTWTKNSFNYLVLKTRSKSHDIIFLAKGRLSVKEKGPDPEGEAHHVEDEDVLGDWTIGHVTRVPHQGQRALYAVRDPYTHTFMYD